MVHLELLSCHFSWIVRIREHHRLDNMGLVLPDVKIDQVNYTDLWHLIIWRTGFEFILAHSAPVEKSAFIHIVLVNLDLNIEKSSGFCFHADIQPAVFLVRAFSENSILTLHIDDFRYKLLTNMFQNSIQEVQHGLSRLLGILKNARKEHCIKRTYPYNLLVAAHKQPPSFAVFPMGVKTFPILYVILVSKTPNVNNCSVSNMLIAFIALPFITLPPLKMHMCVQRHNGITAGDSYPTN